MTKIEQVAPGAAAEFDALHEVYIGAYGRDIDHPYSAREKRVGLRGDAYTTVIALLARDDGGAVDDGAVVGGGWAELPQRDNTGFVYFEVFTTPEHRRRGHGAAVVAALERIGRDAGRSTMFTEGVWAMDDTEPAQRGFAEACGYTLDIMDAQRELVLPANLPALRVAEGYSLHSWRGACPEEWVRGYADVRRLLVQEAPSGDSGMENEFWDVERTREEEAQWAEQGRTPQISVAVTDDGTVVGHTQLLFCDASVEVHQWDTIVLPEHRGHGLGLALKVFTMHEAADLLEGRRRIVTYNATVNEHMIAVNDKLGFRQFAWTAEYVKTL